MIIVKLGGSVITRKAKKGLFKQNIMDNLAREINRNSRRPVRAGRYLPRGYFKNKMEP